MALDSLRELIVQLPYVIESYSKVLSVMFIPLSSFITDGPGTIISPLPEWLLIVLRNVIEKYTVIGDLSLFTLMFSTGLIVFLIATLVKWLIGIIT